MSAASLMSVYDGVNPATLVVDGANGGGPGATPTLAAVLQVGNSAGVDDIDMNGKSLLDLLDLTGTTTALLEINSGVGQGVKIEGVVGASLVSGGVSGCAVTAGGALTLTAATAQPNGLVLAGPGLEPVASAGPTIAVTHIIQFKGGATTYWLPVLSAAPT